MLPSVSLLESFQASQFTVMLVIYLVAITAEAMSGALAAGRRNMDIFGVAVIAFVTALGGGTIRDMVLGHYPIGWTQHPEYVYLVISAGLLTIVVARHMHHLKQVFLLLDAMGLIAFSLIGCNVALELGYPPVVVVMSGMLTGISGGILRDVLCNQVPVVFRRELYASVSLAVCLLFLGCARWTWAPTSAPSSALPADSRCAWPPSASSGACPCSPTSSAGRSSSAPCPCPNPLTGCPMARPTARASATATTANSAAWTRPATSFWAAAACRRPGPMRRNGASWRPVSGSG